LAATPKPPMNTVSSPAASTSRAVKTSCAPRLRNTPGPFSSSRSRRVGVMVTFLQGGAQRTRLLSMFAVRAVTVQQSPRLFRQPPAYAPPLSLDAGDLHVIISRGPVPQPGDDHRLGPALDADAFRPGDGAAADRRGVLGHGGRQAVRDGGERRSEV